LKFYIPEDITIIDSSITEHTDVDDTVYDVWSKTAEYPKDKIVSHDGELFSAFTNIYPLATYSWNDPSNTLTAIVIKLSDETTETPTVVPCVQDVTVVYVIDSWQDVADPKDAVGKYFLYIGITGNVDFTSIDPSSPANFELIINYRHEYQEPIAGQNSIYWEFLEATNRTKVVDKSYNSQSVDESSIEAWWEFEITDPDKVTLFNIETITAKIIVYTTDINDPFYENTTDTLLDTTSIVNWRTLVRYKNIFTKNADWTIPFTSGTFKVRVYLLSPDPIDLKLGEILVGQTVDFGKTVDGIPIQVKSSGKITERENGDVIFEDEGDISKVYTLFDFVISFDSFALDSFVDKCSGLINRRIVVFGENKDEAQYRSLIVYGFSRNASPSFRSNNTKSEIKLQIQRFT